MAGSVIAVLVITLIIIIIMIVVDSRSLTNIGRVDRPVKPSVVRLGLTVYIIISNPHPASHQHQQLFTDMEPQ